MALKNTIISSAQSPSLLLLWEGAKALPRGAQRMEPHMLQADTITY